MTVSRGSGDAGHIAAQPGVGKPDVVAHRVWRPPHGLGAFFGGHSAEIAHFDQSRQAFLFAGQGIQGEVQFDQGVLLEGYTGHLYFEIERKLLAFASPAGGGVCPGMVHQDSAHGLGTNGEEMRAVDEGDVGTAEDPHIGFVDQGRRLEGVIQALLSQIGLGDAMQFGIDGSGELLAGCIIPVPYLLKQFGDLRFLQVTEAYYTCSRFSFPGRFPGARPIMP